VRCGAHLDVGEKGSVDLMGANVPSDGLGLANPKVYTIPATRAEVAIGVPEAIVAVLRNTLPDRRENRASKTSKDTLSVGAVGSNVGETSASEVLRHHLRAACGINLSSGGIDAQAETAAIIFAAFLAAIRAAHRGSGALASFLGVENATLIGAETGKIGSHSSALSGQTLVVGAVAATSLTSNTSRAVVAPVAVGRLRGRRKGALACTHDTSRSAVAKAGDVEITSLGEALTIAVEKAITARFYSLALATGKR